MDHTVVECPADSPVTRFTRQWFGPAALVATAALTRITFERPAELTRTTIHLALIEYAAALWLMTRMSAADWRCELLRGLGARQLWTWACVTFLVHVACAFHFTHHWSHSHAFEQTRVESGFGEGLYVNYLFIAAWSADVVWWWLAPSGYAARSPWCDRILHGFMLFIAFNATVVFETGAVRWFGAIGTSALLVAWWTNRRRPVA